MRFVLVKDELIDTSMHPEIVVDVEVGHVFEKRLLPSGDEYLYDKGVIDETSNDVVNLMNIMINKRLNLIMRDIKFIKETLKDN